VTECVGCAERREKIKAHMKAMIEWVKNPSGMPNPTSLKVPPPPQIHRRPNKAKKDISP
jgi:hypothetical protein